MNEYKNLFIYYSFFNRGWVVILRYIIFIACLLLLFLSIQDLDRAKLILTGYVLFLANELFIHLRVNKIRPKKTVNEVSSDNLVEAVFFRALFKYNRASNGTDLAQKALFHPANQFLLSKISGYSNLPEADISKDVVLQKAYALVRSVNGQYISQLDLFTAYILLSEPSQHLLENSDMEEQDLINIYYWARNSYKVDDRNKPFVMEFYGDGAFDFFVYGWNTELKKIARNVTSSIISRKHIPRVIGRAKEYEQLLVALSNPSSRNVLLVGDPGTGKTSLVEFFAYQSHLGKVPSIVSNIQVYEVFIDRLLAGVSERGDLESRLVTLIDEVGHAGNVIVLIQNIENIFGAGGFDFDISGVLYEYLKNGMLTVIGTTTNSAYNTYIAKNEAVASVFTSIKFEQPDKNTTLFMMFEKVGGIEKQYGVDITYSAVESLVNLSDSYLTDRSLPGKAITVLEDIATAQHIKGRKPIITKETVEDYLSAKTRILLGEPTKEEKELLLNLEDKMHERIVSQERAVQVIASAMRRVRSGLKSGHRPIAVFLFLGQTGVGKTETAKALAEVYYGSRESMIRLDMSEFQTQDSISKLLGEQVGEEYAENAFTEQVSRNPFSLILLDEFEKAHPQILNLFLQVFEDGRLTDNKGRTVSFQNTIIIATSNAGSEYIRQQSGQISDMDIFTKQLMDMLMKSGQFKPELLNRFDETVVFTPLSQQNLLAVAQLLLQEALAPLQDKQINITFDQAVLTKIVSESYDEQFGARNVRRYITDKVSGYISNLILNDQIKKGSEVLLSVDSSNQFTIR